MKKNKKKAFLKQVEVRVRKVVASGRMWTKTCARLVKL